MATVKTNTDVFEKAWEALKELTGKKKLAFHVSFKQTTHLMMVTKASLQGPTERSLKIEKNRR